MGRGVMTEGDHIVYFDATGIEDSFDWGDMQENIVHSLEKQYPSLNRVKKWQDREIAVILKNYHIQIGISEYCGCGAVSVFVNEQCLNIRRMTICWLNTGLSSAGRRSRRS